MKYTAIYRVSAGVIRGIPPADPEIRNMEYSFDADSVDESMAVAQRYAEEYALTAVPNPETQRVQIFLNAFLEEGKPLKRNGKEIVFDRNQAIVNIGLLDKIHAYATLSRPE